MTQGHFIIESMKEKNKETAEKIKVDRQMPYLVGNIVEVRCNLY